MGVRDTRTLTKTKGGATGWGETQINMTQTGAKKQNTSREEGPREKQTKKTPTTNMVDCREIHCKKQTTNSSRGRSKLLLVHAPATTQTH